jgi:hypothetical protein
MIYIRLGYLSFRRAIAFIPNEKPFCVSSSLPKLRITLFSGFILYFL